MDTRNVLGYQDFWDRVDAFFKLDISKDIIFKIQSFYNVNEENAMSV